MTVVFLLLSIFLNIFFLFAFLWVADIVRAKNYFAFTFTNLIQVEEKTLVPVTIHFPNYAFNENIHNMYFFQEWYVSLIHFFMTDTKNKEHVSFESWEKICYVPCTINHAIQLIFLRTSLNEPSKNLKNHWLKPPKAFPSKTKLGSKYKWFKNLIFGILFLKIFFLAYKAFVFVQTFHWILLYFF